jgi:hypothetical protein
MEDRNRSFLFEDGGHHRVVTIEVAQAKDVGADCQYGGIRTCLIQQLGGLFGAARLADDKLHVAEVLLGFGQALHHRREICFGKTPTSASRLAGDNDANPNL